MEIVRTGHWASYKIKTDDYYWFIVYDYLSWDVSIQEAAHTSIFLIIFGAGGASFFASGFLLALLLESINNMH